MQCCLTSVSSGIRIICLREQCRDLHEINLQNKIGVDDVILVKITDKTRPFWLPGRVLELIVGDDIKIRSVRVRRGDGSVQIHSIKLLYLLELSLIHAHHPVTVACSEAAGDEESTTLMGPEKVHMLIILPTLLSGQSKFFLFSRFLFWF